MHVILFKNEQQRSDATLNALRHENISVEVGSLFSAAPQPIADANANTNAPDAPFAVIHEVTENDNPQTVQTVVTEIAAAYPDAALIACRSNDDSLNDAPNKSTKFNKRALKTLGFHAVAEEPSRLPRLLREIEAHRLARNTSSSADSSAQKNRASASVQLLASLKPRQMPVAFELITELHFATDQKNAAQTALAGLAALVCADSWTLYLYSETANDSVVLEPLASRGMRHDKPSLSENDWRRAINGVDLSSLEAHSKTTMRAGKLAETIRGREPGKRIVAVPLIVPSANEKVLGVLEIRRDGNNAVRESSKANGNGLLHDGAPKKTDVKGFSKSEVNLLNALAAPIAAALANAARIAEAERLSLTDDLTKLHNARFLRHFLVNEIKRARRYGSSVAALFLDLDDFKQVNDRHGHLVGSHILREMAQVILTCVRDTDIVARYGGDEFVVILPETSSELATRVAERIRERIAKTVFHGGRNLRLHLTASFGVAAFPQNVQSPQQLLACADTAMYEAKAARKNCVRAVESYSSCVS